MVTLMTPSGAPLNYWRIQLTRILDSIDSPEQLRTLKPAQMKQLGQEIRREVIEKVSQKGGHLAPNLGVVELTIALHYVFDTPNDLLVWDIGHQAYVHKLLTGRRDRFHTIRQFGGLSGYLRRDDVIVFIPSVNLAAFLVISGAMKVPTTCLERAMPVPRYQRRLVWR